jgi:hypothetical protein
MVLCVFLPQPAQYLEGHVLPSPLKGLEAAHQALYTQAISLIPLPEPVFVNLSRRPGIYSQSGRIDSTVNRFLGSLNVYKYGLWCFRHL